jgi:hypothetical protein
MHLYRIEICFDSSCDNLAELCEEADAIFSNVELPCIVSDPSKRVYSDSGNPRDFGNIYLALSDLSKNPSLLNAIDDAFLICGDGDEQTRDSLKDFFVKPRL